MALTITKNPRIRRTEPAPPKQEALKSVRPSKVNPLTTKKYLATLYTKDNNRLCFVKSLGAIFAKTDSDAYRQAGALCHDSHGTVLEVIETKDPFEV
ncbi:hypothetical protein VH22019_00010 [Vibrio phage VH2_2019]|nr:hypothetical protein VH22019_00010 [Vibrio phage VH2_2019]